MIIYSVEKTRPCRYYHNDQGLSCTFGEKNCHFLHIPEYINKLIPKDIFSQKCKEHKWKLMLEGISTILP